MTSRFLTFKLDTKAGHTYKIGRPVFFGKSVIKIIDEATEEEVASQVVDADF